MFQSIIWKVFVGGVRNKLRSFKFCTCKWNVFFPHCQNRHFGVNIAILHRVANSGQSTAIQPAMLEPLLPETCKVLAMKFEVKYLFSTSSSDPNLCIFLLLESLGMRKLLACGIRMQKNPQTRTDIVRMFTNFHKVMQVESPNAVVVLTLQAGLQQIDQNLQP